MKKLLAGIVLYNPEIKTLQKSISALSGTVDEIVLVDNGSKNIEEVKEKVLADGVVLIENGENLGVATALNKIIEHANEVRAEYVLTLDQDSTLAGKDVEKMMQYEASDVAIVCPGIIDRNKKEQKKYQGETEELDRCITSGSLMNMTVCNKVGKFDDWMFIDYVDFDYCKRIRLAGYKIIRVNTIRIMHEVGKRTNRRFLWIRVYPSNHNPERVYYYVRNIYYYLRKYKGKLTLRERLKERILLFWKYFSIILYENNKKAKLQSYKCGKRDGKGVKA